MIFGDDLFSIYLYLILAYPRRRQAARRKEVRPVMKTQRLELTFPEYLIKKPIIYQLVKENNVVPNIRRASVDEKFGWMVLELSGEERELEAAISHLEKLGIEVEFLESFVE